MIHYFDTVINTITGKPLSGVQISVLQNGSLASIYQDANGTPTDSVGIVTSDSNGLFSFYANAGRYDLEFRYAGSLYKSVPNVIIAAAVTPDASGALGNGSSDDNGAFVRANNLLTGIGGGELNLTLGKTYKIASAVPMKMGVTYKGTGRSDINLVTAAPGGKIISTSSSIFTNAATTINGVKFENLFAHAQVGAGHVFDWSLAGVASKVEIAGVTSIQENAAKSIINGTAAGGVFSIYAHDFEYKYATANTVSPMNFVSSTVNSIVLDRFWSTCNTAATSGVHSVHLESTNGSAPAINCIIRDGVFEQPGGGCVKYLSVANCGIETCAVYDLAISGTPVTPNQVQFEIGKGSSGPASNTSWLKGVRSTVGTALKPDCKIDCSVSGQAGFIVDSCTFSYLDGGSSSPLPGILVLGSSISNFQNIAYTRLGAQPGLDLHFGTTDASSKEYTIWNGYAGNNQGYLNFDQNHAYKGAINPSGNFQWGGTIGSPNVTLTTGGGVIANSYVRTPPVAVASLPAAGTVGAGSRAMVSDANATTFNSTVAGGGANIVPVFSDGTNWKIG